MINVRSIRNKVNEVSLTLDTLNLDFLFITETWLNKDEELNFLDLHILEKYNTIVSNRARKGGGCAVILKKEFPYLVKHSESKFNSEIIHFQMNNSKCLNFILVYRPPNTSFQNTKKLFNYLNDLLTFNCIFLGDFNLGNKDLTWINSTPLPKSNFGEIFLDFFNRCNLSSVINTNTRGNALLDLCLTNRSELISNILIHENLFSSDHELITFDTEFPKIKKISAIIKYRPYTIKQNNLLNIYLSSILPKIHTLNFYLEDKYNNLINSLLKGLDTYMPEKVLTKKDKAHKYSVPLLASIKEKKRLYKLQKTNKNFEQLYKSISLHVRIQTRNFFAKRQNEILKKDPKNIFKYINKYKQVNRDIPSIYYENKIIHNSLDKAEIFAEIFSKSLSNNTNTCNYCINNEKINNDKPSITDITFDILDVIQILNKLPNKGTSPDNVNYKVIKNSKHILAPYLLELFRISLDEGKVPNIWKTSIITPIFKKGDKFNPENYRPISITCCMCRIMEKILSKYITQFLIVNNLINKYQYGFIKNRSTTSQFVSTLEDWYDAIFNRKNIDCIFIDFQKAFDSVPHDLLLKKLFNIGIQGKILKWIAEFLTLRTFQVKIGEDLSYKRNITTGVPQGSVLGPLLFLIYINDLPDVIPNGVSIRMFADDVKVYVVHNTKTERSQLTTAIKSIEVWAKTWKIGIAPNKTFVIHIGKNNPKDQYRINDANISEVESIRDLGIIIDNKLKFDTHINKIIRNAYYRVQFLFKVIKSRSSITWIKVYKSYIRPLLEYAPEAWNPLQISDIKKLEKCQKYFTKILLTKCGLPYINYHERLEYFKLPTLENRRKTYDLVLAYKIINGYTYVPNKIFNISNRETNNSKIRIISKTQNKFSSKSFVNRTAIAWNVLDKETILSSTPFLFKNKLKSILVQ